MINIPSTVPTSNTEGLRVKHVPGEKVTHVEKLQNVTDKPASKKMPRKNSKKQQDSEKQSSSQKGESRGVGEQESGNTYQRKLQPQERRDKRDRRKKRSKNFLFDSRSSNTRRSHDARHPSVDIEV